MAVPSLIQSSLPVVPLSATRNTLLPLTPSDRDRPIAVLLGFMSFRRLVPAVVPSVIQSSVPVVAFVALNSNLPFSSVKLFGWEFAAPGLISFNKEIVVPS